MTNSTTLRMLGTLTLCGLWAIPAAAQVSVGYLPVAAPAQDGGYAANARPFSVASAYDGPPPAARSFAPTLNPTVPSATAPAIETLYRPAVPTPAVSYVPPPASYQTANYQPATSSFYRSVTNGMQPVSYVQPVSSLQPATTQPPTLQPVPAGSNVAFAGTTATSLNPCACGPTVRMSPTIGTPVAVAPSLSPWAAPAPQPAGFSPVLALRPMPTDFTVGQGLLGQPKVYVEGEPIRNFFRYILP